MLREKSIGREIRSLNCAIARYFDSGLSKDEAFDRITGTNGRMIGFLSKQRHLGRDVYQRDLEEMLGITRSAVSKALDLMVEKGLVERRPVAHDARLKKLVLTPEALEISERMRMFAEGLERDIARGFTQAEIDTFLGYIERIRKNLGA